MPSRPRPFVVRPMAAGDVDVVADWLQDVDDFSFFDRSLTLPPSKDAIRESWKADFEPAKFPSAYWFLVESPEGQAVAICGLQSVNYLHGDAVLPVLIAGPARGKGLGLRLAMLMLDVAFDRLRLRRVTTYFRSDNAKTLALTTRIGFTQEGRLRQAWFVAGTYVDCVIVGILREEWLARREALGRDVGKGVALHLGAMRSGMEGKAATIAKSSQRIGHA